MNSFRGDRLHLTVFGRSHAPAVGMTLEGLPAGKPVDIEAVRAFLRRRAPGFRSYTTSRREPDEPEFLSGLNGGCTCGSPLTVLIQNTDVRPGDYRGIRGIPRPGHADYPAFVKYGEDEDFSGGGPFSGRMTAPLCAAGAVCIQMLRTEGIQVFARALSVGPVRDRGVFTEPLPDDVFPAVDPASREEMISLILSMREEGDSVGGVIECMVTGLPAGIGEPLFGGMENRISQAVFAIPAVKGIEFGDGFALAGIKGSESNDAYCVSGGTVRTETNRCGGILGGLTDGMPLVFRVAVKPTPSISKPQRSVDLSTMEETEIRIEGRHDPCIVPRAVPCVEAAAAVAVYDAFLAERSNG